MYLKSFSVSGSGVPSHDLAHARCFHGKLASTFGDLAYEGGSAIKAVELVIELVSFEYVDVIDERLEVKGSTVMTLYQVSRLVV